MVVPSGEMATPAGLGGAGELAVGIGGVGGGGQGWRLGGEGGGEEEGTGRGEERQAGGSNAKSHVGKRISPAATGRSGEPPLPPP